MEGSSPDAAKATDPTAKRQAVAVAVLIVRVEDSPTLLGLIAQPAKDDKKEK